MELTLRVLKMETRQAKATKGKSGRRKSREKVTSRKEWTKQVHSNEDSFGSGSYEPKNCQGSTVLFRTGDDIHTSKN